MVFSRVAMIISKTPFRMSFVGGGSDLPAFYREELGAVLSSSIDKYMYICVNRKFEKRIRISYHKTEEVDCREQIQHPLVKNAMEIVGVENQIEIASLADIPSKGSGLGSSSSYTVGLLNALYAYRNQFVSKDYLARQACEIEINRCGEPIGKQDQYAAAYGGLNLIRFNPDDSVSVDPVICKPEVLLDFERSIIIFFTGRTRSASAILARQSTDTHRKINRQLLRRMVQLAFEMKVELELGRLEHIGEMLNENWRLKAQLSPGISDPQIDEWYNTALVNGASGGKLLGAGNGGFLMFYANHDRHQQIADSLSSLERVDFRFDRNGTQVVFYQPA
jgi:D-glycero-alpha-D-manno-heptose-7-phosphate kinase